MMVSMSVQLLSNDPCQLAINKARTAAEAAAAAAAAAATVSFDIGEIIEQRGIYTPYTLTHARTHTHTHSGPAISESHPPKLL